MASPENIEDLISEAAQTAFIDSAYSSNLAFRPQFISNDFKQGRKVLSVLESELSRCSSFIFSVAFITESGIAPLLQAFKELERRDVPGRILTTDYLQFSDPKALRKLAALSNVEMRMYQSSAQKHGFHTKGYLFEHEDGSCKMLVGSSNITGGALTTNREWNLEFASTRQGEVVKNIESELQELWDMSTPLDDAIAAYEEIYREKQRVLALQKVITIDQAKLEPNGMQVAFVSNLDNLIRQGEDKALLISATGTGKTYASAFALRHEDPQRVLFLAHREQLLKQAMKSYERVLGDNKTYGLLSGNSRDFDGDYIFATMQTMSKDDILRRFDPQAFSIIVIDEVHRTGAQSYQKILDYFRADFYLGMTASPDRPDGFDVYQLFDNNIAYEIRLQQALEEDLLCPFHYFGITDLVLNGHMVDDETALRDFAYLTSDERVLRIIEQAEYYGYSGNRVKGLVFCSGKDEARELAEKFSKRGLRSISLTGADSQDKREAAIERLVADPGSERYGDRLDYVFTVDIFNEGVDIPEVNQVIMLRPTQSPIIFVQQLGRGLRKADGKEFVVILDFIGNYANNFMIPLALSGDRSYNKDTIRKYVMEGSRVIPGASSVHFDEIARELIFKSIDKSSVKLKFLREKYALLKNKLGRIPTMVDFLDYGEIDPLLLAGRAGSYSAFLMKYDSDSTLSLNDQELLALEYISNFLANGMRPHELLMLRGLVENGSTSKDSLRSSLVDYASLVLRDTDYESAVHVLDKAFVNAAGEKAHYSDLTLISLEDESMVCSPNLAHMLANDDFKFALQDIVEFGLKRYRSKYSGSEDGLVLYEKYSRKDVCRLLDWERDVSSTMYGYMSNEKTCPIFVTYNKSDSISKSTQYPDAFINQKIFNWMSKSSRTTSSPDVLSIINAEQDKRRLYLFVKKSDGEGADFYYMGRVRPARYQQTTTTDDHGKTLPIVNFRLELETPVRDDIYSYFKDEVTVSESDARWSRA